MKKVISLLLAAMLILALAACGAQASPAPQTAPTDQPKAETTPEADQPQGASDSQDTADPEKKILIVYFTPANSDTVDAVSSATPSAGSLTYSWDLTDQNGDRVPDGVYTVYLEGTLYWESNVLFSAVIDTRATDPGELPVEMLRSEPDNSENETMLKSVRIAAISLRSLQETFSAPPYRRKQL